MNKKFGLFYIGLLILVLFVSYNLGVKSNRPLSINSKEQLTILDNKYNNLIDSFNFKGYEQTVFNHTSVVGVPDMIDGRQDQSDGLYQRTKMLIYKNQSNGNIVLLHMIASQDIGTQWLASLAYQPDVYNSPEGQFASSYDTIYSDCSMYQYSFNHENIRYYITSISKEVGSDGIQPLNEAAKFAEALFLFIK